jgi:hypothetical protein
MSDRPTIQDTVARIVGQVLESHIPHLREELVRRVREELPAEVPEPVAGSDTSSQALLQSLVAIQNGTAQKEILKQLLEQTAAYSARAALFIIKSGTIQGWQARGFANNEALKGFTLEAGASLAQRVLEQREPAAGSVGQMGEQFAALDPPSDGECVLLPLMLKEKVAALLYTDAGSELAGVLNKPALELLTRATGQWLEVLALRKSPAHAIAVETPATEEFTPVPEPVGEAAAPVQTMAAAASAAQGGSLDSALPAAEPHEESAMPPPPPMPEAPAPNPNDIHVKAQRFARLLIDEIKLYNLAKVEEGRRQHDLYERLKDDIEKSRATYEKRYGGTPASSGDYFYHELVRSLAQDDPSLLGSSYRR